MGRKTLVFSVEWSCRVAFSFVFLRCNCCLFLRWNAIFDKLLFLLHFGVYGGGEMCCKVSTWALLATIFLFFTTFIHWTFSFHAPYSNQHCTQKERKNNWVCISLVFFYLATFSTLLRYLRSRSIESINKNSSLQQLDVKKFFWQRFECHFWFFFIFLKCAK